MIRHSRLVAIVIEPDARVASALLLAFLALLPVEPLYNAPFIALAILGLIRLIFQRVRLDSPEHRFLCIAFLCIWLPMLASLPDAVNPAESLRKTASLCLYFLAGVYVVGAYHCFRDLDRVMIGAAAICTFWALDAVWQFQTGADLFGIPHREGQRLSGPFHIEGRLGYVLVSFAPLFFESIRQRSERWSWTPLLLVPFMIAIILSGTRTAWIALAVSIIGYLLFLVRWSDRRLKPRWITSISVAMVLAVGLTVYAKPDSEVQAWKIVAPRVEALAGLWSGDRVGIERAISFRLSIWETAMNMWSNHWLNGVGPRGFQHAYGEYNPEKDYYLLHSYGLKLGTATTPHLQLLEIATETGVIGLLGYVALAVAFFTRLRSLTRDSFRSVYPYALTVIVALFPFGGHLGFYGILATGLVWWMMVVCAGAFAVAFRSESGP